MAFNLGDIFITLKAKTDDLKNGINEVGNFANQVGDKMGGVRAGFEAAASSSRMIGTAIVGAASIGAAAIAGLTLKGGFERALNIQDAEAKLKGLGYGLADIKTITNSTLDAVRGTAYSLDQAMTVAASAMASGIKPGIELTKYIKGVGDAATIAGVDMGSMGAIFNKVQATGKLTGETLAQLSDQGIPVLQWLAKSYHVSAGAMSDMVSQGKVDSERFKQVMTENIGGAALASGNTVRGAWANMQAAMSRAGAKVANEFLPQIQTALTSATAWFDTHAGAIVGGVKTVTDAIGSTITFFQNNQMAMAALAGAVMAVLVPAFVALGVSIWTAMAPLLPFIAVGAALGAMFQLLKANGVDPLKIAVDVLKAAWDFLKPSLDQLWNVITTQLLPSLMNLWTAISPVLIPVLQILAMVVGGVLILAIRSAIDTLRVIISVISAAINVLSVAYGWFSGIVGPIASAFAKILPTIMGALGGVYNAITKPFADAFNWLFGKVDAVVKKLRDLDPFVRHSPSLFDRVKAGTEAIRKQYGGMFNSLRDMAANGAVATFAPSLMPTNGSEGVLNSASTMMNSVTNGGDIHIHLDGATITSPHVADQYAEKIGDGIIRQLQKSWRI